MLEILIVLVHVSRLICWSHGRFLCILRGELLLEYLFQDVIDVLLPVHWLPSYGASRPPLSRPLYVVVLILLKLHFESTNLMMRA